MSVRRALPFLAMLAVAPAFGSCSAEKSTIEGVSTFHVVITKVNGADPPTDENPLPANRGFTDEEWEFSIEARTARGELEPFEGMIRLSVEPGAVVGVKGDGAQGRNILMKGGKASGTALVTAVYGPARLWVEDSGYVPSQPGAEPACANGENDDPGEDVLIDYPSDPGCAFANDDTEEAGTFAAGVSLPIAYELPSITDIQGEGSATPYPYEGMEINTASPHDVVVTRISSDGFYVTDVSPKAIASGYNSLFAFNFSTPPGMRVCDRVTYLAGTLTEFFGFTELSFPSFQLEYPGEGEPCRVPEPTVLTPELIVNSVAMEKLESALVRIEGYYVPSKLGSKLAIGNIFAADKTNCDLNGDGQVDYANAAEGSCANACLEQEDDCSEWTSYSARGNYKVHNKKGSVIQIQTGTVPLFNPTAHRGELLGSVTGTLRNFSGGSLNWTVETRCPDDLACADKGACVSTPLPSSQSCVRLRSIDDNDQGTN